MDITKILNTNRVILDMKATNKTEAIEELTEQEDMDYFRMCKELYVSPDLMSFKLFSMIQRGYRYNLPQGLNSTFLKN